MGQNPPLTPDPTPPTPPPTPDPPPPPTPDPAMLQLQRQNALLQARVDFPNADPNLLGMFQGSPEDLRKMAESLHTKESERLTALSHSSGPAPTPGPGGTPDPADVAKARYRELRAKVLGRYAEPHEREEFEQLGYANLWNQHMTDRKLGQSSSSGVKI